jgi:hypothetical protein
MYEGRWERNNYTLERKGGKGRQEGKTEGKRVI